MLLKSTVSSILALATISSVTASSLLTCDAQNKCPESLPCCGFYGYCSLPGSLECYAGCDPVNSFKTQSCAPNPVCKDTTIDFADTSRIWSTPNTWAGDADNYDLILEQGYMTKTPQGTILLALNHTSGTRLSTSRYMMYGSWTFVAKVPNAVGICSAGITMSDVRDECDVEFPGDMPTNISPNWFYRGHSMPTGAAGAYIGDMAAGKNRATEFHEYTVNWTPESIVWLRDGVVIRTDKKSATLVNGVNQYPSTPSRIIFSIMDMSEAIYFTGGPMDWSSNPTYYMELKSMSIKCAADPLVVPGITGYQYTSDSTTRENAKIEYTDRPLHPYFTGKCVVSFKRVDELLCWQIAAANGLSSADIIALNPDVNCAAMPDDQILCLNRNGIEDTTPSSVITSTTAIPASPSIIQEPVSVGACTKNVTRTNELLCWQIALANNITTAQIIALNPKVKCEAMPNDQILCVERSGLISSTVPVTLVSTTTTESLPVNSATPATLTALTMPSYGPTTAADVESIKSMASVIDEYTAAISSAATSAHGYVGGILNTASLPADETTASMTGSDAVVSSATTASGAAQSGVSSSSRLEELSASDKPYTTLNVAKTATVSNGAATTLTQAAPFVASGSVRTVSTQSYWLLSATLLVLSLW